MDIMSTIISFIEMLSILLIYNVIVNKKINGNITFYIISSGIISVIYTLLRSFYNVDPLIILLGGVFANAIIISKIEKKETIVVTIALILSTLILSLVELLPMLIIDIITKDKHINYYIYLLLLVFIMSNFIYILYRKSRNLKYNFMDQMSKYKVINIIVLNMFLVSLFIKILLSNDLLRTNILMPIAILTVILIGVNIYFYIYLYNTMNEKKKTEIQKSFNPLINELMNKVKSNEHEFKNHLNAIYGIAQVASDEEIRGKVKKYIGEIASENEEFTKLLHIENTIIKAVIYNKMQRADKLGVSFIYKVTTNLQSIQMDDSELTVILSNLLNNAIEATSIISRKEISVVIEEESGKYIINVKNYSEGVTTDLISNMFKVGYTTKGDGRGYGLYNVKKIVDKYKGKINVSLEGNVVSLSLIFDKN